MKENYSFGETHTTSRLTATSFFRSAVQKNNLWTITSHRRGNVRLRKSETKDSAIILIIVWLGQLQPLSLLSTCTFPVHYEY